MRALPFVLILLVLATACTMHYDQGPVPDAEKETPGNVTHAQSNASGVDDVFSDDISGIQPPVIPE
jgi:hypothetical protein